MNKRFTFQYGVRYQAQTPPVETIQSHRESRFEFHGHCGGGGDAGRSRPLQRRVPARADSRRLQQLGAAHRIRLGAATIKPRTVVRAGYSIFYNQSIYNSLAQKYLAYQPPFDESQNLLHVRRRRCSRCSRGFRRNSDTAKS